MGGTQPASSATHAPTDGLPKPKGARVDCKWTDDDYEGDEQHETHVWANLVVPYNNYAETELPLLHLAVTADCDTAAAGTTGGAGVEAGAAAASNDGDGDGSDEQKPRVKIAAARVKPVERLVGETKIPLSAFLDGSHAGKSLPDAGWFQLSVDQAFGRARAADKESEEAFEDDDEVHGQFAFEHVPPLKLIPRQEGAVHLTERSYFAAIVLCER